MPDRAGWSVADDEGTEHGSSRLWLVRVTDERSVTFWVEADDRKSAEEAAEALSGDVEDWDEWERNEDVMHADRIRQRPLNNDLLWKGGEQGEWVCLVVPEEEASA